MRLWNLPSTPDDDTIGHYRELIFYWFAVSGTLSLTPFIAYAFYEGNLVLGLTTLCIVLVFVVDAVFMQLGKKPPVPPILVFIPIIASLCIAIVVSGIIGVLWSYPALMLLQFVLSRWIANLLSLVMIAVISGLSCWYLGAPITLRVLVTLLLTLVFANVFMSIMLELQRRLQNRAIVDPLTGIYNRRHFENCLDVEIDRLARSGRPTSLLFLDIDHFKSINDDHGHTTGDEVLKSVVAIIHKTIRKTDLPFRIGGEEFAVLLPEAGRDTAVLVAEKVRAAVAGARLLADRTVTISIGVDELRRGDGRDALLERCDIALYRAKERGRNRVELAEPPPAAT